MNGRVPEMKLIKIVAFFLYVSSLSAQADHFIKKYNAFLKKYTSLGWVDYKKISKNKTELNTLVQMVQKMNIRSLNRSEKKAFWINAYNIFTIETIIKHYPVPSPRQIPGFFNREKHSIGGQRLTLDGIEHNRILKIFKDERAHFALVCAAKGCPKIRAQGYEGSNIENAFR